MKSGKSMNIIKANRNQYEDVRNFYYSMIDAMSGSTVYVGWQKDIYPSAEFLGDSVRKGELYLVLEDENITAAMVFNHDHNEGYDEINWPTKADDSEVMIIHALGVHPDYYGKGYAKALVREAINMARESGIKAIRLDVLEGNIPAEKLYSGFGFQYTDKVRMFYEDTGWTNFKLFEYRI